jgi:hypothetical protein
VHEWIYIVYEASKPGTEVDTGTTYGSSQPGRGSQSAVYFLRYDGATGSSTIPRIVDDEPLGHQTFPDISADGGVLHVLWWDSRFDPCYSPARPIGNCSGGATTASLDVWGDELRDSRRHLGNTRSCVGGEKQSQLRAIRNRAVPFAGDYLWITSMGHFSFGAWTDWRDTVPGVDAREGADDDKDGADVMQCRTPLASGGFTADTCPRTGGLDQNIYGTFTP